MKKLLFSLALVLLMTAPLQAQRRFGVRAGITDGEPMVGVEMLFPITGDLFINPNVEFSSDLYNINGDVHYDFDINADTSFWIGAGIAFVHPENGDYEAGVNLLGGIGTRKGRMYPYAQVKFTGANDAGDYTTLAVGVRF
jgi:hypothetical protein